MSLAEDRAPASPVAQPVRGVVVEPALVRLPGFERARLIARGEVPRTPLAHLTGIRLTHVAPGSATVVAPAGPWLLLADGSLDLAVVAEHALVMAALTGTPAGCEIHPAALSVHPLVATSVESETLVGRARIVRGGRKFIFVEATIEEASGRVVAFASASVVAGPAAASAEVAADDAAYRTPDPWQRSLPAEIFRLSRWADRPGVEVFNELRTGSAGVVPFQLLTGMEVVDVSRGSLTHALPASPWFRSRCPHVSPGVLAGLVSVTLGGAALTLSPGGMRTGTLDQSVTFLEHADTDGTALVARARVVHEGVVHEGCTAVLECEVTDGAGTRVAYGHQTATLIPGHDRAAVLTERRMLTLVFTDIVASTERAARLGDEDWGGVLRSHHATVRRQLDVYRGTEVKTTGDGFLVSFDAPGRALHFARAVRDALRTDGTPIRVGIHTGETELSDGDVSGIAVHVAARVLDVAAPGDIVVSGVVRELAAGSGLAFTDLGEHTLRGIDAPLRLFAVDD